MDSPHIGSDNSILTIITPKLSVQIKQESKKFEYFFSNEKELASFKSDCREEYSIQILDEVFKTSNHFECNTIPLFFEQKKYLLFLEPTDDTDTIKIWHENKAIRDEITRTGIKHSVISGIINFQNNIGYSDFLVYVNDELYLKLTIEVFPSKISYKSDYRNIITDLTIEIYNLIFDYLKKTYLQYDQDLRTVNSSVEFIAIIEEIFDKYIQAVDFILKKPIHQLQVIREEMPARKIRSVDTSTISWINKHSNRIKKTGNMFHIERVQGKKAIINYDTNENRFVKYALFSTYRKLKEFQTLYNEISDEYDVEISNRINAMADKLLKRLNSSFMDQIELSDNTTFSFSQALSMTNGYRDIYKYYLILKRGLSISGRTFNVSVKEISTLYEYWCFIKLNSILRKRYELVSQDIIKTNNNGLYISLAKGSDKSTVKYKKPSTGESITLSYNAHKANLPTISQKPDNVLTIEKRGSNNLYQYIFDAKYRIDFSVKGSYYNKYIEKIPGPKEEDINTMHRYRDSIVYCNDLSPYERIMFGSYVLFPYSNEDEYVHHKFYKSIESVNIGGLPFLPGHTKLVTELLDKLVGESTYYVYRKSTPPIGINTQLKKSDWVNRNILFYQLNDIKTYEEVIENKSIQCWMKLSVNLSNISYIAFYYRDKYHASIIASCGKISFYEKRSDYTHYFIDHFVFLNKSIKADVDDDKAFLTNMFLLENCKSVSELYLESEAQYWLYSELKNKYEETTLEFDHDKVFIKINDISIGIQEQSLAFMTSNGDKAIRILGKSRVRLEDIIKIINDYRNNCL